MDTPPIEPDVLGNAKRPWALSAAILGALYLLLTASSVINNLKPGTLPAGYLPIVVGFGASAAIISIAFLVSALLALRDNKVGLTILTYVPIVAIAYTLIQGYFQYTFFQSDAYTQLLTNKLQATPNITPDRIAYVLKMSTEIAIGSIIVISLIQLIYCTLLYIKISAEPTAPVIEV